MPSKTRILSSCDGQDRLQRESGTEFLAGWLGRTRERRTSGEGFPHAIRSFDGQGRRFNSGQLFRPAFHPDTREHVFKNHPPARCLLKRRREIEAEVEAEGSPRLSSEVHDRGAGLYSLVHEDEAEACHPVHPLSRPGPAIEFRLRADAGPHGSLFDVLHNRLPVPGFECGGVEALRPVDAAFDRNCLLPPPFLP